MNPASTLPVSGPAPAGSKRDSIKRAGVFAALAALLAVLWMPAAQGLPPARQVMLAILAFAVIVWMTEALDYAVSSVVIDALMIFLLAYRPDAAKPAADMGTGAGRGLALSGFFQQRRRPRGGGASSPRR